MAKWLCCLPSTVFEPRRHQPQNDLGLGSPERCILISCDIHRSLWSVCVYGELKGWSEGTLRQADLLSRGTPSNSCRKNIQLSNCLQTAPYTVKQPKGRVFFLINIRLKMIYPSPVKINYTPGLFLSTIFRMVSCLITKLVLKISGLQTKNSPGKLQMCLTCHWNQNLKVFLSASRAEKTITYYSRS